MIATRLLRFLMLMAGIAAVVGAVVLLAEELRPPGVPTFDEPLSDPRVEIECPTELPDQVPLVTSSALYDCPAHWDGIRVRYQGEAVGAVLRRGDEAWVQLNDDIYAGTVGPLPAHRDFRGGNAGIGVRIDAGTAADIAHVGGPGVSGDIVEVTGVFHRVDEATAEIAVIRAETAGVVRRGALLEQSLAADRAVVAVFLVVLLLGFWRYDRWRTARRTDG
jgi:hypothetical protein